jgi:phage-related protein
MVGVFLDEWPELEPTLLEFVGILADGMSAAVPVISNLAQSILPSLISTLGTLFDAAGPVLSVIGDLAQEILPPLAGIISELAANALPPLRDIFDELNYRVVQPLMPVLQELAEDLLPVLGIALGSAADMVGPLADAFMPLLTNILPAGCARDILPLSSPARNLPSPVLPGGRFLQHRLLWFPRPA